MRLNVGNTDRLLRVIAGLVLTSLAFIGPANPWFLLGLIPLFTGVIGWCPVYRLFGIDTHKPQTPHHT